MEAGLVNSMLLILDWIGTWGDQRKDQCLGLFVISSAVPGQFVCGRAKCPAGGSQCQCITLGRCQSNLDMDSITEALPGDYCMISVIHNTCQRFLLWLITMYFLR